MGINCCQQDKICTHNKSDVLKVKICVSFSFQYTYTYITEIRVPPHTTISTTEYNYNAEGKTLFVFSIKGCRNAWVSLWNNGKMVYELGLGKGNNRWSSLIKNGRSDLYSQHIGPVIDCNKYMQFYITWKNGFVDVGKGLIAGKDEILSLWENPLSSIDEVKLSASGAELHFIIEEGKFYFSLQYLSFLCAICVYLK